MFPSNTRILIADDMAAIRGLVKAQLATMGFTDVYEAADGLIAFSFLKKSQATGTPIQLVISDWNMPNMTGLDFLKKVRSSQEWENLPFILLTSEAERDQITEAIMAGVSQYLIKPFSAKTFEAKLKAVWAKHSKKNPN